MNQLYWKQPIFILGNPRSGTSLLRLMLDSHPEIGIPPESHFFLWLEEKFSNWNSNLLVDYIEDLYKATKFETWNLDKDKFTTFLISNNPKSYHHLTSLVYYYYYHIKNKKIKFWGDKNSLWPEKFNTIKKNYPEAFYIYLIRDGRDVACSYRELKKRNLTNKYAPNLSQDIKEIANSWTNNNLQLNKFLNSINSNNWKLIKYEDLIQSPKNTLVSILDKIGVTFKENQLAYYNRPKESIEPDSFFSWKEKLMSPPDMKNIGKYHQELTIDEISTFNYIAKEVLIKNNYL